MTDTCLKVTSYIITMPKIGQKFQESHGLFWCKSDLSCLETCDWQPIFLRQMSSRWAVGGGECCFCMCTGTTLQLSYQQI